MATAFQKLVKKALAGDLQVSKITCRKTGVIEVNHNYFYPGKNTAEKWADRISAALADAGIRHEVDSRNEYHNWPKDSYFVAIIKPIPDPDVQVSFSNANDLIAFTKEYGLRLAYSGVTYPLPQMRGYLAAPSAIRFTLHDKERVWAGTAYRDGQGFVMKAVPGSDLEKALDQTGLFYIVTRNSKNPDSNTEVVVPASEVVKEYPSLALFVNDPSFQGTQYRVDDDVIVKIERVKRPMEQ